MLRVKSSMSIVHEAMHAYDHILSGRRLRLDTLNWVGQPSILRERAAAVSEWRSKVNYAVDGGRVYSSALA